MIKQDADKEYLARKVEGYQKQGDNEMAERFLDAYLPIVGSTRKEIMKLIQEGHKQAKQVKKEEKKKGDD
jgi:hypothetical protein